MLIPVGQSTSLLSCLNLKSCFSVVCCTETWLSDHIYDNEILPSGYSVYRNDRPQRGGGVMIAVKDSLSSSLVSSPKDLEVVSVAVGSPHVVTST